MADARRVVGGGWPAAVGASTPRVPSVGRAHGHHRAALARSLSRALLTVPFTLGYTLVLLGTGLYARLGDPGTVRDLLASSSTDVFHLSQRPLLTLLVSALWAVGGITSPYLAVFPLVLGALERRLGGVRTAAVFLLGHVLATLLTEVPVAVSVAAGHLPDSSLRRLDYGVSYGLIACAAALAGLLSPRRRGRCSAGSPSRSSPGSSSTSIRSPAGAMPSPCCSVSSLGRMSGETSDGARRQRERTTPRPASLTANEPPGTPEPPPRIEWALTY
ncbi:rhomboid-like protein [Streptomyces indonesiensis]